MFGNLYRTPVRTPEDVRAELLSICLGGQVRQLGTHGAANPAAQTGHADLNPPDEKEVSACT